MGSYNVEEAEKYGNLEKYRLFPSTRSGITLVAFFGCVVIYLMRVNLSVAIVCMTVDEEYDNSTSNSTTESFLNQQHEWYETSYMWVYEPSNWKDRPVYNNEEAQCPGEAGVNETAEQTGEFNWDRQQRGTINSSFFWGYVLTQLLGGIWAIQFGVKWVLGLGVLIQVAATMLSPPASNLSPYALMAMRFIEGLGSGVFFPCVHHLAAMWSPANEKSLHLNIILSGTSWGSLMSFALSGIFCAELGWEWVFWIYGIVGMVWFVFWVLFAFDPPEVHPRINQEELDYIQQSQHAASSDGAGKDMKTPWFHIMFSPTVLVIYLSHFCNNWGGYTILTSLPQYIEDVLKVDIAKNGLFNSLPHLVKFILTISFGVLADFLINKRILSARATRNLMQTLACVLPSALLILVGYLDCYSTPLIIGCITIAEGFAGGNRAGGLTNILDVAPRFAALLMGVSNTIANFAGIFAPIVAASLTPNGAQSEWRYVFFLTAGLYMFSWVVYVIFSKGEVQKWAMPPEDEYKNKDLIMDVTKESGNEDQNNTYVNTAFTTTENLK